MQHDLTLTITGMTCASCVQSVEHLALKVKGVEHAAVNLPMARGRFTIEGGANDSIAEAIISAIPQSNAFFSKAIFFLSPIKRVIFLKNFLPGGKAVSVFATEFKRSFEIDVSGIL